MTRHSAYVNLFFLAIHDDQVGTFQELVVEF
jgi:hypothetical protein